MLDAFTKAAELVRSADGLLVTAGAGLGVDSGLPDFRSANGFWKTYPALARAGIEFESIACPETFRHDPRLAWGFYGHRLNLYRQTTPHRGFALLQEIGAALEHGLFVLTSNVDGQFQKAGVADDQINEIHGSIHHLQCMNGGCSDAVWSADGFAPILDDESCRLLSDLPVCPKCGGLARPNILMFGDWDWRPARAINQEKLLASWLDKVAHPVVVEIGAGTDLPTVRRFGDRFERLIRINPREPKVSKSTSVGIALGGLEALRGVRHAWAYTPPSV